MQAPTNVPTSPLHDPGFWFPAAGVAVAALTGALGVLYGEASQRSARKAILLTLVIVGALFGIGAAWVNSLQSLSEKQASEQRQIALQSQNAQLRTTANATYADAKILLDRSIHTLALVRENLKMTRTVGGQTRIIGAQTQAVGGQARIIGAQTQAVGAQTRIVGVQTRVIARQARELQVAAADSLKGIDRLASPLADVSVTYDVAIPIDDPALRRLKTSLIAAGSSVEQQFKEESGAGSYIAPDMPLSAVFAQLTPYDVGDGFVRSMDLAIEIYRPPFPNQPYYGDTHQTR